MNCVYVEITADNYVAPDDGTGPLDHYNRKNKGADPDPNSRHIIDKWL